MAGDVRALLSQLPPYQGRKKMIERRQDTDDIIFEILKKHKKCAPDYDKICTEFWKGDPVATCKYIFDYLKKHTRYEVEPVLSQTVKTPAAILWEGFTEGNDCKHYASYINGICCALARRGYPVRTIYRFACYDKGKKAPGHVFAVLKIAGREIFVDPVLDHFDQRNPRYFFKIDKTPPMADRIGELYDISGIPNQLDYVSGAYEIGKPKLTDFLVPGSRELRFLKNHAKKHKMKATDFLIPGSHGFRVLRELKRRHHNKNKGITEPVPKVGDVNYIAGFDDDISGCDHYLGTIDDMVGGLPWDMFAVGKKPKDPNAPKKKKGIFRKIAAGVKKVTLKTGAAPSRNAYLLMLKMNAFHLASNIMKKVKDPGQSAGENKVLPKSVAWQKIAKLWKGLGGNEKVLWKNIVQGTRVWNKHHKNNAIHGMYDMDVMTGLDETYQSTVGYIMGLPPEDNEGIGFPPAIAAALVAATPVIAALRGVLNSLGIKTDHIKKGATDAEADLIEAHNEGGGGADGDGSVQHGGGTSTKVVEDPATGAQTVTVDYKPQGGGDGGSTSISPAGAKAAAASAAGEDSDTDAPAPGDSKLPAASGGSNPISAMLATAKNFYTEHKKPINIAGGVTLAFIGYKKIVQPMLKKGRR